MQFRFAGLVTLSLLLTVSAVAQDAPATPQTPSTPGQGMGSGQGRGRGGWGMGMAGRGVAGTVSEVAADHYTVKTMEGETTPSITARIRGL